MIENRDDYLHINRHVLAELIKSDPDALTEERALDRIHSLVSEVDGFDPEPVDVVRLRNGDHQSAKFDPATDTVTVTMTRPFNHAKETISELRIRAPRFGDMQAIADKKGTRSGLELLARCCGRTINELAGMHARDVVVCLAAVGFLQGAG